jgi:multicomponent Na+:H+ antiporter subunit D
MYTAEHVVWTLQILLFTGLAFFLRLKRAKPKEGITLDTDWFYRKGAMACLRFLYLLVKSKAMKGLDPEGFCKKGAKSFMRLIINPWYQLGSRLEEIFLSSIPQSLSWFCKNPLAACKIASDTAFLYLSKNTDLSHIEQERKRIDREKEIYPGDIIKHWPIGSTVLWVTLFLLTYLLVYYL